MKLLLFVCCESASIDIASQNLSLFNLFETVNASSFPLPLQRLTVVTWAEREKDEPRIVSYKTRWLLNGNKIGELPFELDFQDRLRSRAIIQVAGLVINEPGVLEVQLRLGTRRVGSWTIQVQQVSRPHKVADGDGKTVQPAVAKKSGPAKKKKKVRRKRA